MEIQVQGSPNPRSIFLIIVLQVNDCQITKPNQKICEGVGRNKGSILGNGMLFSANTYCELPLYLVIDLPSGLFDHTWFLWEAKLFEWPGLSSKDTANVRRAHKGEKAASRITSRWRQVTCIHQPIKYKNRYRFEAGDFSDFWGGYPSLSCQTDTDDQ